MVDQNDDAKNQTWPEYLKETWSNIGPSAKKYGEGLVQGLDPRNLPQTIEGLGTLGRGAIYNFLGDDYLPSNAGKPMPETAVTPIQKMQARRQGYGENLAQIEQERALASDVGKGLPPVFKYTMDGGYQGGDPEKWKEFSQRFKEDPIGTASLAALPLSGFGGTLSKVAGTTSRVAEAANLPNVAKALDVARKAGNVAEATKYADPATSAIGLTSLGGKGLVNAASSLSGVDDFGAIKDLFAQTGDNAPKLREVFKQYASGRGDPQGLMQNVNSWVKEYRQNKINEWASKKQNLANQDIPLTDVLMKTSDEIQALGDPAYKLSPKAQSALDFLVGTKDPKTGATINEGLFQKMHQIDALPPGHPEKNLLSLDKQKQQLWDLITENKTANPTLSDALVPIHTELVKSLTKYGDPDYAKLMQEFQDIQSEMGGITAATGSKMNQVAQYKRIMSSRRNPVGKSYLDLMSEQNPEIGAALLGASSPSKVFKGGIEDFALPVGAGFAFAQGQPLLGAAALAGQTSKFALGSPGLTTGAAKTLGAMDRNLLTGSAKSLASAVPTAARAITPFQSNLDSAYNRLVDKKAEEEAGNQIEELYNKQQNARGGRIDRASGGRTMSKDSVAKAMALIAMADRIKKEQGKDTSSLLNLDDTTVAKALAVANRGI